MNINSDLKNACLEVKDSSVIAGPKARIIYDTVEDAPKFHDGSNWRYMTRAKVIGSVDGDSSVNAGVNPKITISKSLTTKGGKILIAPMKSTGSLSSQVGPYMIVRADPAGSSGSGTLFVRFAIRVKVGSNVVVQKILASSSYFNKTLYFETGFLADIPQMIIDMNAGTETVSLEFELLNISVGGVALSFVDYQIFTIGSINFIEL